MIAFWYGNQSLIIHAASIKLFVKTKYIVHKVFGDSKQILYNNGSGSHIVSKIYNTVLCVIKNGLQFFFFLHSFGIFS